MVMLTGFFSDSTGTCSDSASSSARVSAVADPKKGLKKRSIWVVSVIGLGSALGRELGAGVPVCGFACDRWWVWKEGILYQRVRRRKVGGNGELRSTPISISTGGDGRAIM